MASSNNSFNGIKDNDKNVGSQGIWHWNIAIREESNWKIIRSIIRKLQPPNHLILKEKGDISVALASLAPRPGVEPGTY